MIEFHYWGVAVIFWYDGLYLAYSGGILCEGNAG